MQKLLTMIGAAAVAIGAVLPMSAFADTAALSVTVSGNDVSVSAAAACGGISPMLKNAASRSRRCATR